MASLVFPFLFPPIDKPRVAVAVVVENRPHYEVKAHFFGYAGFEVGVADHALTGAVATWRRDDQVSVWSGYRHG